MTRSPRYTLQSDTIINRDGSRFAAFEHPLESLVISGDRWYGVTFEEQVSIRRYSQRTVKPFTSREFAAATDWTIIDADPHPASRAMPPQIFEMDRHPRWPYWIEGSAFLVRGHVLLKLAQRILEVLCWNQHYFVLVADHHTVGNVHCFSATGQHVWRIAPFPDPTPFDAQGAPQTTNYLGITLKDQAVWVYSRNGYACRLNHDTGEILEHVFTR